MSSVPRGAGGVQRLCPGSPVPDTGSMQTATPGGPLDTEPWREAFERALYGPDGFFVREAPGRHFRTSATATPVFAAAVRELAARVDEHLGRPDPFDVVDLGAGGGELLQALPDVPSRWRLTAVELAPDRGAPDGSAPDGRGSVRWTAALPEVEGLLFANEWLDAVPLDVLFDGRVVEVAVDGTERLGAPAPAELLDWAARWWPQGRRVEVGLTRDRAWADAVAHVRRGLAVAADYGHVLGDRSDLGDRRPTLTGYRDGRQVHPVLDGSCDITAHVAVDACLAATGGRLLLQREALTALGVDPTPPPRDLARTDPRGYLERLQAANGAAELLDRRSLGSYAWLVRPVDVPDPF
jgi:SAM-dependent MidA family methyltransferase